MEEVGGSNPPYSTTIYLKTLRSGVFCFDGEPAHLDPITLILHNHEQEMRVRTLNIPSQVRWQRGFTIVELLIVIVIIGILAAITIVAYNSVESRAQAAKYQSDLNKLEKAIVMARNTTSKTLIGITGSTYTASGCVSEPAGTDLATVPKTDSCWTQYFASLSKITAASGMNVSDLIDPWGRPYYIDENEGEGGTGCIHDHIAAYTHVTGDTVYADSSIFIPNSGNSGCAT